MTSTPLRPTVPSPGPNEAARWRPWTPGRVIGVVASVVFLVIGSVIGLAGAAVIGVSVAVRDEGMYTSAPTTWSTTGYAIRSEEVSLHSGAMMPAAPSRMMGEVEVTATTMTGHDVFVGIARTADVEQYLGEVARSTVEDPWAGAADDTRFTAGGEPAMPPSAAPVWITSASGPGTQTIRWTPRTGRWCLVVMNEDGTAPVAADVTVAAELPIVDVAGATLLATGLVVLIVSGIGLWLAVPRAPHHRPRRS